MENEKIEKIVSSQRLFFDEGNTKTYDFRILQLKN